MLVKWDVVDARAGAVLEGRRLSGLLRARLDGQAVQKDSSGMLNTSLLEISQGPGFYLSASYGALRSYKGCQAVFLSICLGIFCRGTLKYLTRPFLGFLITTGC